MAVRPCVRSGPSFWPFESSYLTARASPLYSGSSYFRKGGQMTTPKRQHTPHARQPIHLDRLPPLYARPRDADDDVERECVDPSLSHQGGGVGTRAPARDYPREHELTEEELELVTYLRKRWGFNGAVPFVRAYGYDAIMAAVHDVNSGDPKALRNPAGFIRWLVEQATT
jgi:hypothetical protein